MKLCLFPDYAVASPKNIAGADRLARDVAHTEKEIAYYLERLDIIDEAVDQGFDDQPKHREAFTTAMETLGRRKDRLVRRQDILKDRDETALVFGESDARPMGYGRSPKTPCYNMQSVVDVDSGLIIHHDVTNEANDSQLLHPMSMATMEVLEVDELKVLADGGYSNAEEVARCESEAIIGEWMASRGCRDRVVVATKVGADMGDERAVVRRVRAEVWAGSGIADRKSVV